MMMITHHLNKLSIHFLCSLVLIFASSNQGSNYKTIADSNLSFQNLPWRREDASLALMKLLWDPILDCSPWVYFDKTSTQCLSLVSAVPYGSLLVLVSDHERVSPSTMARESNWMLSVSNLSKDRTKISMSRTLRVQLFASSLGRLLNYTIQLQSTTLRVYIARVRDGDRRSPLYRRFSSPVTNFIHR